MKIIHTTKYLPLAALVVADGLFFGSTDPNRVNSLLLIAALCLVAANIYALLRLVALVGSVVGLRSAGLKRFTRYGTAVLTLIVALNSIGELTTRDVAILMPLALLLYLYMTYVRAQSVPQ